MNHIEPKVPLDELDPGLDDPGYWMRTHARIMQAVQPRLQFMARQETMGDVLLSWGRLVVPFAGAAAAVAALAVFRPVAVDDLTAVAGLEEWLQQPTGAEEPLPAFLHGEGTVDRDMVLFAMEQF